MDDDISCIDKQGLLEITTLLDLIAVQSNKGKTHISIHEMNFTHCKEKSDANAISGEETILLPDVEASPTESFLNTDLDAEFPTDTPFPSSNKIFCLFLGVACMLLLQFGRLEPYTYTGLMYRRHWCGLIMADGGNGCLFM